MVDVLEDLDVGQVVIGAVIVVHSDREPHHLHMEVIPSCEDKHQLKDDGLPRDNKNGVLDRLVMGD